MVTLIIMQITLAIITKSGQHNERGAVTKRHPFSLFLKGGFAVKKLFIIVFSLLLSGLSSISALADDNYGDGYQRGYKKGYQYQENGGIEPIAPIAPISPIPKIGERGYDDGYRRGVIEGHGKRQKEQNVYRY